MPDYASAIGDFGNAFSGILTFFGNALANDARTRAAEIDMQTADENAQIAAAASADALRRGQIEAAAVRLRSGQFVSQEQVQYQNSGIDPTTGTGADLATGIEATGNLDAQTAANNAAREAWGFKRQQTGFQRQGQQLRAKYDADQVAYSLNQTGTIVSTAGSAWKGLLEVGT
jgi:hypothetical protein